MSFLLRRPIQLAASLIVFALLLSACGQDEPPIPAPPAPDATAGATAILPTPSPDPTADLAPSVAPTEVITDRSVFLPQVVTGNEPNPTTTPHLVVTPTVAPTATAVPDTPAPTPTLRPLDLADLPGIELANWPRPANDNGICIHNTAVAYFDEAQIDQNIARLKEMNMRWTLVHYADELQLMKAAPRYRDAGIMVVWRKALRANERYYSWGRDIELLRSLGVEPYMQLYNEPSLPAEWNDQAIDQRLFLNNLLNAIEQVYNAGGYVGLQFVSDDWLRAALAEIEARGGQQVFQRMFLVPHPYALNHPPDYTADSNGVLGFLHQADIVRESIGFVPPMIAGEGGWKWNATDDRNFPPIDEALHRDYHVALFNWFQTGVLSNGEPLPDYLFAFCPWLLSDRGDDSAWFDSFAGDHTPTIDAVKAIPPFVRRFSWDGG